MARKKTPELDLRQFLPYRLDQLAARISKSLSTIYGERFGLMIPEWRVLAWLSNEGTMTAKDIARLAQMDKATTSRSVQRLAERGLIQRETLPHDQRSQQLSLTKESDGLLSELLPLALDWEARLLENFTAQELRDLQNLLGKLERQLARMNDT
ncbi:MAG: MarR family transcriptional regulator [Myxococcaceae bacterium]